MNLLFQKLYPTFSDKEYRSFYPYLQNKNKTDLMIHWHQYGIHHGEYCSYQYFRHQHPHWKKNEDIISFLRKELPSKEHFLKNEISVFWDELISIHPHLSPDECIRQYIIHKNSPTRLFGSYIELWNHSYKKPWVTFLIPSIGRDTLNRSLKSLQNIKHCKYDWNCIVIFDGIKKPDGMIEDQRIRTIEIEKSGSGVARNWGMKETIETEWIAFLDDDDTVSSYYLRNLEEELQYNPLWNVVLFRMGYSNHIILPEWKDHHIIENHVGISFSFRRTILEKPITFQNHSKEDYHFLKELEKRDDVIMGISSYVNYFVRCNEYMTDSFPRIQIEEK